MARAATGHTEPKRGVSALTDEQLHALVDRLVVDEPEALEVARRRRAGRGALMAAKLERTQAPARRSSGTGSLYERTDSTGRVVWYGKCRSDGVQLKRRIGAKRVEGSRDGLTRVHRDSGRFQAALDALRQVVGRGCVIVPLASVH